MLFSNKIKTVALALVFICTYTIPQTEVNKKNPKPQVAKTLQTIDYSKLIAIIQNDIAKTKDIMKILVATIHNGSITSLKNKKETINYLNYLIERAHSVETDPCMGHTEEDLYRIVLYLLDCNAALMHHVSDALSKGFHSIAPETIETLMKKQRIKSESAPKNTSPLARLARNKKLLDELSYQAEHAGLQWYNHLYRKFDDSIVDPCIQYDIIPRSLMVAGAGFGALAAWWKFANNSFVASPHVPQAIKDAFGAAPGTPIALRNAAGNLVYDMHGRQIYEGTVPLTFLGNVSELFSGNNLVAAGILGGYYKDSLMNEWNNNIKPGLSLQVEILRNRLKGGVHNKIANALNGLVNTITFKDLIGLDHVVKEFKLIVDYMENPELHSKLGTIPDKGYLLVGPPRTGKTLSVNALFNEIARISKNKNVQLMSVSPSDVWRKGIKNIFAEAAKNAPCILFFDEINLLGLSSNSNRETLQEFMTGMSGIHENRDPKKQVIIIGATNKPEQLEQALREPGRFGNEIRFKLPSLAMRKETIQQKIDKLGVRFADPVIAEQLIAKTALESDGISFEGINKLVNDAYINARQNHEQFGQKHLEYALNTSAHKIVMHLNETIPAHEQHILATHFAGQALMLHLLDPYTKLAKVTILPYMPLLEQEYSGTLHKKEYKTEQARYEYGALFTYREHDTTHIESKDEQLKQCKIKVAGAVAEELILGAASHSCHPKDMKKAHDIAKALTFEGIKEVNLSKAEHDSRSNQALAIVESCKKDVRALLSANKDKLTKLINTLKEKKILNQQEVLAVIK